VALVLSVENLSRAEKALNSINLQSRLPLTPEELIQFREEYIRNKKLLAWRFMNPQDNAEIVDLLILEDLKDLQIQKIKVGSEPIPVISKKDLIKMKQKSDRPQDREDIKALEAIK
jgi:hypothetical protein